jgi:predicted nucleic acid-binding Zn ribbon protein
MPEYVFRCGACFATKSEWRHVYMHGEIPIPDCDKCLMPMSRDYSIGGVIFKGEGWAGKS